MRKRNYGKDEDVMADKKRKTDAVAYHISWARNGKFLAVATDKGRVHSWYIQVRDDEDLGDVFIFGLEREKVNMRFGFGPSLESALEEVLPSSITRGEGVGNDGILRGPRAEAVISAAATASSVDTTAIRLATALNGGKSEKKQRRGSRGGGGGGGGGSSTGVGFNNGALLDVVEAVAASPAGAAVAVLVQTLNKATKAGRKAPYRESP